MTINMTRWSLMLLRNLSLERSRIPVILSHQAWMELIIEQCITSGHETSSSQAEEAAYSALWCLLHQSQKAVSVLKKHPLLDKILARTTKEGCTKSHLAVQILCSAE